MTLGGQGRVNSGTSMVDAMNERDTQSLQICYRRKPQADSHCADPAYPGAEQKPSLPAVYQGALGSVEIPDLGISVVHSECLLLGRLWRGFKRLADPG